MAENYFPRIDTDCVAPISLVLRKIEEDPTYLDDPECPYLDQMKDMLTGMRALRGETEEFDAMDVDLEKEISTLYKELSDFGRGLTGDDNSERNTYFRLSVSLLEKLLVLQERAAGLNNFRQFVNGVMNIMEDQLSPDQRTNIVERLNVILHGEEA